MTLACFYVDLSQFTQRGSTVKIIPMVVCPYFSLHRGSLLVASNSSLKGNKPVV